MKNYSLDRIFSIKQRSFTSKYLTNTKKLIIIYGIASGMAYLHKNNIIHQNLKSTNILMDDLLLPKISDISLCSNSNSMQKNSIAFIAPGILNGSNYSESSDIFSFGLIMYQIVTNERPYKNLKNSYIAQKVKNGERPLFHVPVLKSYQNLIKKCWSQDPNKRPSFDQIVRELQKDAGFITDAVNSDDFKNYIRYIEACQEEVIPIESFINQQSPTFQKVNIQPTFVGPSKLINKSSAKIIKPAPPVQAKAPNGRPIRCLPSKSTSSTHKNIPVKPPTKEKNESLNGRHHSKSKTPNSKEKLEESSTIQKVQPQPPVIKPPPTKEEIAAQLEKSTLDGDPDSMFKYANLLEKGEGVPQDSIKALLFYKLSGEQDNLEALMKYGEFKMNHIDFPVAKVDCLKLYKDLADKGLVEAMFMTGTLFFDTEEPHDFKEAAKYFGMAADKGHVTSMFKYGAMLNIGNGVEKDVLKSIVYFQKAADNGNVEAMYLYALFLNGIMKSPIEINIEESAAYLNCAADQGHSQSMFLYGLMLQHGYGVPIDNDESNRYIRMSSKFGFEVATLKLKADETNDPKDLVEYGDQLLDYNDDLQHKEATIYYKKAADLGDGEGMVSYAQAIGSLKCKKPNYKEAIKY